MVDDWVSFEGIIGNMRGFIFGGLLLSSHFLLAQRNPYFGASLGISVSNQQWETSEDVQVTYLQPRLGAYIGVNMEFYDEDILSLLTEMAFIQKGTRLEWQVTDPSVPAYNLGVIKEQYNLSYLHWWVAIKLKADWEQMQPYVLLGPRIDLQLSEVKAFPNSSVNHVSAIFGGVAGMGFQYKPRKRNFRMFVQGTYLMDFRDLHFTSPSNSAVALNIRNTSFAFSIGIQTRVLYNR